MYMRMFVISEQGNWDMTENAYRVFLEKSVLPHPHPFMLDLMDCFGGLKMGGSDNL